MPDFNFKYALYGLVSVFLLSVGGNAWTVYKITTMQTTIDEQLNGKLGLKASILASLDERLGTGKSKMVTRSELEEKTSKIISGLDAKTQDAIKEVQDKTDSRIDSISEKYFNFEGEIRKGISSLQRRRDKKPPVPPPPKSWSGVKVQDQDRCSAHPERCEPFEYSWASPLHYRGKPILSFSSDNLWSERGNKINLNLAYKLVAFTLREGDSLGSGAVQNEGIVISAGYINEKGEFIAIPGLQHTIKRDDPNFDPKIFYVPKVDPFKSRAKLGRFEPSLLVGSTFQGGDFGLSIGGSLVNLYDGEYRMGANFALTESNQYLGVMGTWHPFIAGKNLNIAPGLGWVYGSDGSNTWSLGIHFQVW